ncbi:MAG TPA: AAA family ATPase, partial [Rikenellaceae bacterium]|nr:AAA family ATPase [Rikenellaceae bacterium]
MSVLIKRGQIDDALSMLADFLQTVPYCDNTNYEGHYQQMLYIIFALLTNYNISVEQHTAKGRIDITLETRDTVYVMELKFDRSPEEALSQIESKRYSEAFKLKGKAIVAVGLNFAVKDGVNTLEWAEKSA